MKKGHYKNPLRRILQLSRRGDDMKQVFSMFIDEQKCVAAELQYTFLMQDEFLEKHVWSPQSCRFTSWTYEPLCRCDERGNINRNSRRRCPFIIGA